ncbi:NAD(+)/NADH kinase [Clostridium luticellarii]|jgi:NAD+ kinase|uniref:NAD kinase n=1 Tax=Clostridium luticellarii TaxID=1691940 RepID=A0A2T0BRN6_9CLOT|nr:NAD(+)/NADH kinase [Clostridium luticellarii]MCI1943758.1 NAD(+)/NADH kinase [Clostridium luticellarii]MCI1967019.1 NAD(+)/NADH kinase [Clostridium luticellarii]MCI1994386.1 NAD(+)/NADH kinase [Clostridium luticellarii]MCI2038661.1 NAD(+)/NADH kinase [Clostridium luticellarii]PRR86536.1 putative inorganic polyphosphate/ATP-NAD kinase [Clostridium luticellarii]
MKNIGINVNTTKNLNKKMLNFIIKNIRSIDDNVNIKVYEDCRGLDESESNKLDIIIVLGGDGTILNTSKNVLSSKTPILGINIGHLGFLAQVEISNVKRALNRLFRGEYAIEERDMLQCSYDDGNEIKRYDGLNDVVLCRKINSRIQKYDVYINDIFYNEFNGDGIIVCTSTGSTGYNLSAGGPIIHPSLNALCLTPMYSQSLTARTIILDSKSCINIASEKKFENVYLSIDGQRCIEIDGLKSVKISMSENKRKLIKFDNNDYFNTLKEKITFKVKGCEHKTYEGN